MKMGTTIFETDMEPGRVLMDEICGDGARVRMFTLNLGSACVVMRLDLARIHPLGAEMIRGVYDLPAAASVALVGVVVKHTGLETPGRRTVSLKVMDEYMGPYQTGGANRQLLSILSPLRSPDTVAPKYQLPNQWAREWRKRAWQESDAMERARKGEAA